MNGIIKIKQLLFSLIIIALLNSCSSLYIPNSINAPLLTSKNEATITVNTGMNGWDLQAAYSPLSHLGLMINTSGSPILSKTNGYHGHKYAEGGLGFTTSFGSKGVLELYSGAGLGNSESQSKVTVNGNSSTEKVQGMVTRYFVQPSIGVKNDNAEFAFSTRGVYAEFYNVRYGNSTDLNYRYGTYFEMAFTMRKQMGNLMFQSQIGASLPLSPETTKIKYRPLLMSFGLTWRIGNN